MNKPTDQYHTCEYCQRPVPFGENYHPHCRIVHLELEVVALRRQIPKWVVCDLEEIPKGESTVLSWKVKQGMVIVRDVNLIKKDEKCTKHWRYFVLPEFKGEDDDARAKESVGKRTHAGIKT